MNGFRQTPYFDYFEDSLVFGRFERRPHELSSRLLEEHGFMDQVDEDALFLLVLELEDRVKALEEKLACTTS